MADGPSNDRVTPLGGEGRGAEASNGFPRKEGLTISKRNTRRKGRVP